jgi:HSP20 family protein
MAFGTLIRRHPVLSNASAFLDAERLLNEFQKGFAFHPVSVPGTSRYAPPRFHAVENEEDYAISAEIPGVDSDDLSVVVEEGVLTIAGGRKDPAWRDEMSDEEKDALTSSFERRIRFNVEVDDANVQARYKDGLLVLSVPKAKKPTPEVRTIPVEVS